MNISRAQIILNNDNSTNEELEEARITFRKAGLKNLSESCRLLIIDRTVKKANALQNEIRDDFRQGRLEAAFNKAASALLAKAEACIAATPLEIRDKFEEKTK
jgi:shikimate 5-dehydrogenase